jgi:hypothetical protein
MPENPDMEHSPLKPSPKLPCDPRRDAFLRAASRKALKGRKILLKLRSQPGVFGRCSNIKN